MKSANGYGAVRSCNLGPFEPLTNDRHCWRAETKRSNNGRDPVIANGVQEGQRKSVPAPYLLPFSGRLPPFDSHV